jgi:hypothetical protein
VLSLANATLGVIRTAFLAVDTIGQGLALARGLVIKHPINQVDRLLFSLGIGAVLRCWVPYVVGGRTSIKFRDTKDPRFGVGMGSIHVSTPARRDRLWLLNTLAIALLTWLGAGGEAPRHDCLLKSNTQNDAPTRCSVRAACSTT